MTSVAKTIFPFQEEHELLRVTVRDFVNNEIRPIAAMIDEQEDVPLSLIDKMIELGFFGVVFPTEYGGGGFGEIGYCVLLEEISRACASTAVLIGGHQSLGAMAIYLHGSEEQKQCWIPKMAAGEILGAYAMTEPGAGSDAGAMKTLATAVDGGYVLNGSKTFITNGSLANVVVVFAVTDTQRRTHGGITAFLIDAKSKGFSTGKPEKKMGIRGSKTTDLFFENVFVPNDRILGNVGDGFKVAMETLDVARVSLAAHCLGAAKELVDMSAQHANTRIQFGKPIAAQQSIQNMFADMATKVYTMETVLYRTAWMCDQDIPRTRESAIAKLFCSEALCEIADAAMQIHGGMGYMREYPIERYYRDARIHRIFEGTNEILRLVVARDVIKNNGY